MHNIIEQMCIGGVRVGEEVGEGKERSTGKEEGWGKVERRWGCPCELMEVVERRWGCP